MFKTLLASLFIFISSINTVSAAVYATQLNQPYKIVMPPNEYVWAQSHFIDVDADGNMDLEMTSAVYHDVAGGWDLIHENYELWEMESFDHIIRTASGANSQVGDQALTFGDQIDPVNTLFQSSSPLYSTSETLYTYCYLDLGNCTYDITFSGSGAFYVSPGVTLPRGYLSFISAGKAGWLDVEVTASELIVYGWGISNTTGEVITAGQTDFINTNEIPVAILPNDFNDYVSATISIDGSQSNDADANYPLSYSWELTNKPTGSLALLSALDTAGTSFVADIAGIYTISLVVTDSLGAISIPETVNITVIDNGNDFDLDGVENALDCAPYDSSIYPGASEIIRDGIDQDCNGYDLSIIVESLQYNNKKELYPLA